MNRFALACLLFSVLHQLGCPGPSPGPCSYNGHDYKVGETFPSEDGCNICSCQAGGSVTCTERACAVDGGGGADGGDVVMCAGAMPSFPSFAKTCVTAADCLIGTHQINCCGAMKALGINQAEKDRFAADEKICEGQYPGCGCPAAPTVAEDGQFADIGKMIVVECQATKCMTLVK